VVQVWGWPGSGRAALLAALVRRSGAVGLAPEEVATPAAARRAVQRALEVGAARVAGPDGGGGPVLVCPGLPREADAEAVFRALAEAVPEGAKLVVATAERWPFDGLLGGLVTPRDLALRPDEVAALWREETGHAPGARQRDHLVELTDGWWRVLGLVAGRAGVSPRSAAGGAWPADGAALVALPEVTELLRIEVLAALSGAEQSALADPGGAPEAVVRRLRERRGLLLEEPDGTLRPPAPLAALVARDGAGDRAGASARPRPGEGRRAAWRAGNAGAAAGAGPGEDPASRPAARFRLRLLGRPEVLREEANESWQPVRFTLRRGLRLLGYLATSPERTAPRDELTEALWPEEDRETIERNFHPTLSHLRRDLRGAGPKRRDEPALLVFRDGLYTLDPDVAWWIDLEERTRLADAGRELAGSGRDAAAVERWEAAWRLHRGPLLDGIYDPWATGRRERVQRRQLALLRDLGAACERLGRNEAALDAYRALLVDDPLEERVHVALMRLYAARGRRDLVRRQYERLSLLLRTELGVEPLQETAEEYHRLMIERG